MTAQAVEDSPRPIDYPNPPLPGWPAGPNARQAVAHDLAPYADELLYGGARGGGKTDFLIAEGLRRCLMVPGLQAVIFRRTYRELSGPGGIIPRLMTRVPRNVGRWAASTRRWHFLNGSVLTLSYLETEQDVQAWMGLEIQWMGFDQVEQLDEQTYVMVRTSLRASGDVAARLAEAGLRPSSAATANPGGRGHTWVKRRWIDPYPLGEQLFRAPPTEDEPHPMVRVFVPAKLSDNPALELGDPTYRARLQALPDDDRRAQLDGDWDVFKGSRFAAFRTRIHVVRPEDVHIPLGGGIARGLGVDYGSSSPFVGLWGALLADDLLVVYREVWAEQLAPREQARLLLASEAPGERGPQRPIPSALDPSTWAVSAHLPKAVASKGGQTAGGNSPHLAPRGSIAWHYQQAGLPVVRADNRRIEGAAEIARRLTVQADGLPRLLITTACPKLIETLPSLQRDPRRPEDVLKGPQDHWYDALRYLVGVILGAQPPAGGPTAESRPPRQASPVAGLPASTRAPTTRGLRRRGF